LVNLFELYVDARTCQRQMPLIVSLVFPVVNPYPANVECRMSY